ncbi:M48 family metallopeptidase [Singulisphaera sp. PoT]|uniref:M48 family metallopeptidase n=1 Tax=Singulisphaera sp. PoT TaxID=3411797 RepID=UPI003BF5D581
MPWIRLIVFLGALAFGSSAESRGAEPASAPVPVTKDEAEVDERQHVAVPVPTPTAMRYYRTGNWLWGVGQIWAFLVPAIILWSGISARIQGFARRMALLPRRGKGEVRPLALSDGAIDAPDVGDKRTKSKGIPEPTRVFWFLSVGIYIVAYLGLVFLIDLPLDYYRGFVRQHEYGLSNQSFARWIGDAGKMLMVDALTAFFFTWIPLLLIARRPRNWWLVTTLLTIPFIFVVVMVKPVWVDPLFNEFGPMKDKGLEAKIVSLADKAGIGGSEIFEVDKSRDTKAMNAYVTGVFGTRRIVLWDTLIAKLNDREVLAVMGHEMGHYVLGHIPRSILLSSFMTLAGLFWVDRAGRWLIARNLRWFGFERLSDAAAIPLILLLMHASSLVLVPVANAYSRNQEHEADRFALEITRANRSAAQAFATLQRENLSNPRPGLFFMLWRSTHPSIAERIEFCNTYRPWETGEPFWYKGHWEP